MGKINAIVGFLSGRKTYAIGVALIIVGLYKNDTQMVLEGLGLCTLRAGINKVNN